MDHDFGLPLGFKAAGLHCGIKPDPNVFDLALFAGDGDCVAAGVFTRNRVCGAPVKVSRERVPGPAIRAVILNSGNANACTGQQGIDDARAMTADVARHLGCEAEQVLVCSTGVIGRMLPMTAIQSGVPRIVEQLSSDAAAFEAAARGMMTTDTRIKIATRSAELVGQTVHVGGAAKGAAMIGPNMATMLSVIMTDAELTPADADAMLRHAVDRSFHCISVEGHTSTSDSVILLASGAVQTGSLSEADRWSLQVMLDEVAQELAQAIVSDSEGASHLVTIDVQGLTCREDAMHIAKTIANDALVKTAIAGNDPNWGRIVSCVGRTGIELCESDISLKINGTEIYRKGTPVAYDEETLVASMRANREVFVELTFPFADQSARFWTSDLTVEYVRLNSEYTT